MVIITVWDQYQHMKELEVVFDFSVSLYYQASGIEKIMKYS